MATTPTSAAVVYLQELRDGSWIGNATWAGRTLTDGATEPQPLMRRLAARLAAIPEAGRPQVVKMTRIPQGGEREERDTNIEELLA
jgi:hypothetical protein